MRDHGRHLPRFVRVLLVLVLAAVDVVAYRAAVEVAFDTSDEWPAIIDSYILSLLSLGMVMAAMFAGEQLKTLHTSRDQRVIEPEMADNDQRHARRVWLQAGVPALIGAVASARGRLGAPRQRTRRPAPLVLARRSGVLGVGGDRGVLRRVQVGEQGARRARRPRAPGPHAPIADCAGPTGSSPPSEGEFRMREAEITQMWSLYEPSWRVQLEMAAARIAVGPVRRDPDLFHPLGRSVVESVHERIARGHDTARRASPACGISASPSTRSSNGPRRRTPARRRGPAADLPALATTCTGARPAARHGACSSRRSCRRRPLSPATATVVRRRPPNRPSQRWTVA